MPLKGYCFENGNKNNIDTINKEHILKYKIKNYMYFKNNYVLSELKSI